MYCFPLGIILMSCIMPKPVYAICEEQSDSLATQTQSSIIPTYVISKISTLVSFYRWTEWFSFPFSHIPEVRFSRYMAHNWAAAWQNQQSGCAPNEDSDQHGHPPSLIRVFAVRMKKPLVLSYPLSAPRRLWSDWADAQADLSLRWVHTNFVGFIMSWPNYLQYFIHDTANTSISKITDDYVNALWS